MNEWLDAMRIAVLLGVAAAGLGVVRTREPAEQAVAVGFFGLVLGVLFLVYQAPDVALSQIVIGAVALPLMILLALARIRKIRQREELSRREGRAE